MMTLGSRALMSSTVAHSGVGPGKLVKVTRDKDLPIATVTMSHPPVNALTPELISTLLGELQALEKDPAIRGLILTSEIQGIFSAGVRPAIAAAARWWLSSS